MTFKTGDRVRYAGDAPWADQWQDLIVTKRPDDIHHTDTSVETVGDRRKGHIRTIDLKMIVPTQTAIDRLERLESLARRIANHPGHYSFTNEARQLVAEVEPVDADLVEARRVVADKYDGGTKSLNGDAVRAGARDKAFDVQLALAAIKRGRALEKEAGR